MHGLVSWSEDPSTSKQKSQKLKHQKKKKRHESKRNIHNNTEILAHIDWTIEILIDSLVDWKVGLDGRCA